MTAALLVVALLAVVSASVALAAGPGVRNLEATVSDGEVRLTWTPADSQTYVAQYVLRKEPGGGWGFIKGFGSVSQTEYTDTSVEAGRKYLYRVKAIRSNGAAKISGVAKVTIPASPGAPVSNPKPSGLTATAAEGEVTLNWTHSDNPDFVKQVLKRRESEVRPAVWTTAELEASVSSYRDSSVESGRQYIYRVQAVAANNRGPSSNSVQVRVP